MTSYEQVLEQIGSLTPAKHHGIRDVRWISDAHVIGVARDPDGRVEVFLRGAELAPSSSIVRAAMKFQVIHRIGQPEFDTNLLALPALGHFDQVAAFICTELFRSGADSSLAKSFQQTEPIIELAIERMYLSNQAILGLAGELLLIDALCRRAQDAQVTEIVAGWDGWRRSSRDLTVGRIGIEVKTTTGPSSSHQVEGIHQVECNDNLADAEYENQLILVSIGLQVAIAGGNAFTIPQLMDSIIARMSAAGVTERAIESFILRVAEYGAAAGGGYDHHVQASNPMYETAFLISFFRAYDMSDGGIEVLRRSDVATHAHVAIDSVCFRIDLPPSVSAGNPVLGANQVADAILGGMN